MCAAHDPVEHYYPHDYVHRASRARAHVFSGINFGDLVKNSPIHLLKSPQKFPAIRYMYGNTKLCLWAFCLGCGLVYNDKWEIQASTKVKGQLLLHHMFCSAHLSTHTWHDSHPNLLARRQKHSKLASYPTLHRSYRRLQYWSGGLGTRLLKTQNGGHMKSAQIGMVKMSPLD